MVKLNSSLIKSACTPAGGFTSAQLRVLGLVWPPHPQWIERLEGVEISDKEWEQFRAAVYIKVQPGDKSNRKPRKRRERRRNRHMMEFAKENGAGYAIGNSALLPANLTKVNVFFDGGANPNPGNGYGSYEALKEDGTKLCGAHRQEFGNFLTCNEAEYMSLLGCLQQLYLKQPSAKDLALDIKSDSKLVVMQVRGAWKIKNKRMFELCDQVRKLLVCFGNWTISWHARNNNVKRFGH